MAADIKIQRGQTTIGSGSSTTTLGASVGSLDNAFLVITANRHTTGGDTVSTNREVDDLSLTGYLSDTSTITWDGATGVDKVVDWEVWEYTGSAGGANEFIVRSRYGLTYTSATSATQSLTSDSISDYDDCIPFIQGAISLDTSNGANGAAITAWITDAGVLTVECGENDSNVKRCRIAVVEFTGSAWSVGHGRSLGNTADSGSITLNTDSDGTGGSTFNVTSWSQAIIASWGHKGDGTNEAIADHWPVFDPGTGTSTVDWTFDSNHDGTDDDLWVHVLDHTDLDVTRYTDTSNTAGVTNIDITSAGLSDITEASILGTSTSSGSGTAYGRGWRSYRLTSTTNAQHRCHRSGNTLSHNLQVIDWSGLTSTSAQSIEPTAHTNNQSFTAPSVDPGAVSVEPTAHTNNQSFTAPVLNPGAVSVEPTAHTNNQSFTAPSVDSGAVSAEPTAHTNNQSFPVPGVATDGGPQDIGPTAHTNNQSFTAPTLNPGAVSVGPTAHSNNQSFTAPSVDPGAVSAGPTAHTNNQSFTAPNVQLTTSSQDIAPSLLTNSPTFPAPAASVSVAITPQTVYLTNSIPSPSVVIKTYSWPAYLRNTSQTTEIHTARVLDTGRANEFSDEFWSRLNRNDKPLTFVKVGSTWSEVRRLPGTYDRLVGGGYETEVTEAELDELVAAGLLTTMQKSDIMA